MLQSSGWRCRGYGDMYRCVDNRCIQASSGFPTNASCQAGCGPLLSCQTAMDTLCGDARNSSSSDCLLCCGEHNQELEQANCTTGAFKEFCQGGYTDATHTPNIFPQLQTSPLMD